MRVLHLIETLGRGGAEQLLVTLMPALAEHGVEPVVGVLNGPFDLQPELEKRGIRVIQTPAVGRWNLPAAHRMLSSISDKQGIALIHAHLYFPSIYAAYNAWRGGVPMVETFHNLAYAGANRRSWKLALRKHLRSRLLRRGGARFYGVSDAVAQHYAQALGLDRVETLPNGIDLAAIQSTEPLKRSDDALQIVVPGRLVKEKGHADLLAALSEVNIGRFVLRFIGGGPLEAYLRSQAASRKIPLEISGKVDHTSFLSQIAAADLVVIPSHHEGFGLAAAEAMALGKPIIASDAGGLAQVVGSDGLMYLSGDVAALAAGLGKLASDRSLREALGTRGRQSAFARFGADSAAERLARDYRSLAKAG
ncbi:glycosyltransferase family 4 protein [Qipengyuania sp. CAU 1752]